MPLWMACRSLNRLEGFGYAPTPCASSTTTMAKDCPLYFGSCSKLVTVALTPMASASFWMDAMAFFLVTMRTVVMPRICTVRRAVSVLPVRTSPRRYAMRCAFRMRTRSCAACSWYGRRVIMRTGRVVLRPWFQAVPMLVRGAPLGGQSPIACGLSLPTSDPIRCR